jgi:hypothetical protein
MDSSDEALVRACRRGEEDAWAALINRYRRFVDAIPRRAGSDEELASDVSSASSPCCSNDWIRLSSQRPR